MVILEHAFRWQKIWWLLSLDRTRAFFRDLWVPVDDTGVFQEQLRACLTQGTDEESFYHHPQKGNDQVARWFTSAYGCREQKLMVLWADHVYVSGTDRVAEDLWANLVSIIAPPSDFEAPAWVGEIFSKVREARLERSKALEDELGQVFGNPSSEWDASWTRRRGTTDESLRNNIELIASLNAFVRAWEQFCNLLPSSDLDVLYDLGERAAKDRGMADHGVAFPGSWRLELKHFTDVSDR